MSMFRKIFKPSGEKGGEREDIRNIEYKRKIDPLFRDPLGKGHLHILMEHGYDVPEDLEYVLSCGCEINIGDNDSNYPIHIAVRRGLNKCVKKLIQRNSLLDVFNNEDLTPLMIAAKNGHAESLFNLLQNGANPNLSNKDKRSAMHYVCLGGSVRCLKLLLEARGKVNHQDINGNSPIIHASKNDFLDQVKCLLEYSTFPKTNPNKQDNERRTALHWAVEKGFIEIVRLFLDHNVDTSIQDSFGDTPFTRALKCNQPDILQLLVDRKCRKGFLDGLNGTSLGLAALFGFDECLRVLLLSGELPDEVAYFGISPLMAAVFESKLQSTEILLDFNASVDLVGRNGTHALPLAFLNLGSRNEEQRHSIVKLLLRSGSNPNIRMTSNGPCALYLLSMTGGRNDMVSFAMLSGYVSMLQMILIAGATTTKSDVDLLSSNTYTSQGFYVSKSMIDVLQAWTNQPRTLKQLTRTCIRRSIGHNTKVKLDKLNIAKPLIRFLNFEELNYINIEQIPNRQIMYSASNFVSITPCGLKALSGSLLHDSMTPTTGLCNCQYCKRYEESIST